MVRVFLFLLFSCGLQAASFFDETEASFKQYVQTREDKERYAFFKNRFEKQSQSSPTLGPPKTFHFIWLGPKLVSQEAISAIQSWLDIHPAWVGKFWSDQEHPLPDARLQKMGLRDFPLQNRTACYFDSDNEEERSELLRYAILFNEGGVYVDLETKCVQSIDSLQENFDFFCELEPFGPSILSSSVNVSPRLIGAASQHPVLFQTLSWVQENWKRVEEKFPGNDPVSVGNRVKHRTFKAFNQGVVQGIEQGNYRNIVFAPNCFKAFCRGFLKEAGPVKQMRQIEKRLSSTALLLYCLAGINCALAVVVLRKRRARV